MHSSFLKSFFATSVLNSFCIYLIRICRSKVYQKFHLSFNLPKGKQASQINKLPSDVTADFENTVPK